MTGRVVKKTSEGGRGDDQHGRFAQKRQGADEDGAVFRIKKAASIKPKVERR